MKTTTLSVARVLTASRATVYLTYTNRHPLGCIATSEALEALKQRPEAAVTAYPIEVTIEHLGLPFIGSLDV